MTTQTAHYYIASISGSIRDDAGNMVDSEECLGYFPTRASAKKHCEWWRDNIVHPRGLLWDVEEATICTLDDMADMINLDPDGWQSWYSDICSKMGWIIPVDDGVLVRGRDAQILCDENGDAVVQQVDRSDPTGVDLLTSLPVVGNLGDASYKLIPYVRNDGELWLAATGNGCADDVRLPDLDGVSEDKIDADWGHIDLGALRIDADEIATVNPDAADWLRRWADEVQFVTGN